MDRQLDSPQTGRRGRAVLPWLTSLAATATIVLLVGQVGRMQAKFSALESDRADDALAMRREVAALREAWRELDGRLADSARRLELAQRLEGRLGQTERALGQIGARIAAHRSSLERIEAEQASFGPEILAEELSERDAQYDSRWESLSALVSSVKEATAVSLNEMERLESGLAGHRDLQTMWRELVGPVVQLAGDLSVGSGVLLRSEETSGAYRTHLLTAWHVVRDIQGDLEHTDMPVPVLIYGEDGTVREEAARLLAFEVDLDVALLAVETPDELPFGAELASPARLSDVRIFDEVYAVGCPLGNDPIPTYGEVATVSHVIDGESYWMINAPTYIGNSGGGIFDSETHELLGIFSKIYTHGSLRPTIVPHMGLVTPLTTIYDWLQRSGYASVVPTSEQPGGTVHAEVASASVPD